MTGGEARGSALGLLAYIGLAVWLVWLLVIVGGLTMLFTGAWLSLPYSLAIGLGVCQLLLVIWGQGRALGPARRRRSLEYPPDDEGV